jgi:hypothetical protein
MGAIVASGARPVSMRALTVLCAWLVPGLGHVLLGRVRRGLAFAAIVLGSFALGMTHDGRLALRDVKQPVLSLLQVVANAGVGPLDAVARVLVYGEAAYAVPLDTASPSHDRRVRILRDRTRSVLSIYGTAYLWTAGLMNLLLLFDVWDLASGRKD